MRNFTWNRFPIKNYAHRGKYILELWRLS